MQMQKAIIGKKVGMTQIFDESGKVIPVTVIEAGPCVVTQKKTAEKDGYAAVQLGFEDVKESKLSKPEAGHLKKAEVSPKRHLKEFRIEKAADMNVGEEVKASIFAAGDKVDVTGISKGHGYRGRCQALGASAPPPATAAALSTVIWAPWAQALDPSRIFPGHIGAGQMGVDQVTVQNLDVVKVDPSSTCSSSAAQSPAPRAASSISRIPSRTQPKKGEAAGISQPTRRRLPLVRQPAEGLCE
jgi:large subunit ribosomal protein L3